MKPRIAYLHDMTITAEQYRKRADFHNEYLYRCRQSKATHSHQLVDVAADTGFSDICVGYFNPDPMMMIGPLEKAIIRLGQGRIASDIDQSEYVRELKIRMMTFIKKAKIGQHYLP